MNTIELNAARVVKRRNGQTLQINVSPIDRRPREYISGERVRLAMMRRSLTPREFAKTAELDEAQVSRLLHNNPRVRLSTLVHVAEVLGVSPRYLTGETEE